MAHMVQVSIPCIGTEDPFGMSGSGRNQYQGMSRIQVWVFWQGLGFRAISKIRRFPQATCTPIKDPSQSTASFSGHP